MKTDSPTQQLTLPVNLKQEITFNNFYGEANTKAATILQRLIVEQNETLIYIAGPNGSGKTHLLISALAYLEELNVSVCYFSLKDLFEHLLEPSEMQNFFESLGSYSMVILDDLDAAFQNRSKESPSSEIDAILAFEKSLFNLFNLFKMTGQQLLLSAKPVPGQLNVELPDLASRLKSGLLINLIAMNDMQKEQFLQTVALQKGLSLDEGLSAYIIKRSGRDLRELLSVLETLDQASLSEKRKLSVPFAKKILNW